MKRMNKTGSVVKLKGNRRKPYMAKITLGVNKNNKQVFKIIGYFVTKQSGIIALNKYNKSLWNKFKLFIEKKIKGLK